jgi:hypothetical protein
MQCEEGARLKQAFAQTTLAFADYSKSVEGDAKSLNARKSDELENANRVAGRAFINHRDQCLECRRPESGDRRVSS